jgi:hypothetical protein
VLLCQCDIDDDVCLGYKTESKELTVDSSGSGFDEEERKKEKWKWK